MKSNIVRAFAAALFCCAATTAAADDIGQISVAQSAWEGELVVEVPMAAVVKGDVNGDGVINVVDIVEAVNHMNNKTSEKFDMNAADMNGDGRVTALDLNLISQKILGK